MKSKKSQVTIFIILGLIILAGIAILIYFKTIGLTPKTALSIIQEEAPAEFKPVQSFITQCLKDVSEEAIRKIGMNGGYIDTEDQTYGGPSFKIDETDPTQSDILKISSAQKVPYWYYMYTYNKCEYRECNTTYNIPTIESIEQQIINYVTLNIESCFNNFEAFNKTNLLVTPLNKPVTSVKIAEKDIQIQLQYPINIKKGTLIYKLEYYNVIQHINFIDFYNTAFIITNAEAANRFLEKGILYVMSIYQVKDISLLPPLYLTEMNPNAMTWSMSAVTINIQELLKRYLPLFRIQNTKNAEVIDSKDKIETNIYNYIYLTTDRDLSKYEIKFYYLDWPVYLYISPSIGDLIKPHITNLEYGKGEGYLPSFTKNTYSFLYDLSFPTLVEIKNKEAFDGKGYSFFIALEGNVKNNYDILTHMLYDLPPIPEGTVGFENMDKVIDEKMKELKDTAGEGTPLTKPTTIPSNHIFCDEAQRLGPEITFSVKDLETNAPLEKSSVFYQCGPFFSCRLGGTDKEGLLKTKLPLCEGGAVKVSHIDYFPQYKIYNSKLNMPSEVLPIQLFKPKEKKFKIKILNIEDLKTVPATKLKDPLFVKEFRNKFAVDEIGTESTVILTMSRIKENAYSIDFARMAKFELISSKMEGELDLVPAQASTGYKLNIIYINNTLHHMDGSSECVYCCESWKIWCSSEYADYPAQDLEKTIPGSAVIDEDNFLWAVDYDDLTNQEKDTIIFYLLKMKLPTFTKNIGDLGKLQEYSKKYRWFIQPEFVSSKDEEVT